MNLTVIGFIRCKLCGQNVRTDLGHECRVRNWNHFTEQSDKPYENPQTQQPRNITQTVSECPNCRTLVRTRKLAEHIKKKCPSIMIACTCGMTIQLPLLQHHVNKNKCVITFDGIVYSPKETEQIIKHNKPKKKTGIVNGNKKTKQRKKKRKSKAKNLTIQVFSGGLPSLGRRR